ncbi:putative pyrimidine kinase [Escherichia coli]|uniref:Putative pyrimidine kinase n=1 Tax=Escherichia coli TaxID=562 RepID=A0A377B851_ECOLX|nr:putative pyrimidine kinase [Escherichia coli]
MQLRRNPLIQQNEIADMLQISRSRVAAHIMDLMRKGRIKGKGYILTEQEYCVVVGTINMDIRGMADIHYPQSGFLIPVQFIARQAALDAISPTIWRC